MASRVPSLPIFLLVLALISIGYLLGAANVPFHPDESTQLFTSGDVELFLQNPANLFWSAGKESDPRQVYRELDAPLTHIVISAGRWLAGRPALPVDWSWSHTWEENQQAGALPDPNLLLAGRMAVAALFPFSVLFLFLAVRRVANDFTAWAAALLLATNALVLLHTRRAMAEGALLFSLTFTLWSLVKAEKRPWLTAIPAALAFCAKQLLAPLGLVGLLAVLWQPGDRHGQMLTGRPVNDRRVIDSPVLKNLPKLLRQAAIYGLLAIGIIFLLNPVVWGQPVPAIQAMMRERQRLATAQAKDRPEQTLNTPGLRLVGLLGSVYFTPPQFAETANYLETTRPAETAYLANPLNTLFRSFPAGSVLLILGLGGFVLACTRVFKGRGPALPTLGYGRCPSRRGLALLLIATVLQSLALLVFIRLPWQRYYLPVVPFACLWAAYGIDLLRGIVNDILHKAHG